MEILRTTKEFDDVIKAWNHLAPAAQTWTALITHFENEYKELLKLRGPTIQSSSLHHANVIVEQAKDSVQRSVESSIKRHVANATVTTQQNNGTIKNKSHLPPALQNLPPGYTLQEIHPDQAIHVTNATTSIPA